MAFIALCLFVRASVGFVKYLFIKTPIGWNFIQPVGVSVFASRTILRTSIASGGNGHEAEIKHHTNRSHRVRTDARRRRLSPRERSGAGERGYKIRERGPQRL